MSTPEATGTNANEVLAALGALPGNATQQSLSSSCKLFVGQIPKTKTEADMMPLFQNYGTVVDLKIIRNKLTNESNGCCFVTYASKPQADACIAALHNNFTLPPCANALQVRFADGEEQRLETSAEHKLFLGQLPKETPDAELMKLFEQFGRIEEFKVLREASGISKGCAFLKYADRESALQCIRMMDNQHKFGNLTLQVRFADTPKTRDMRLNQQRASQAMGMGAYGMSNPYGAYGSMMTGGAGMMPPQPGQAGQFGAAQNPYGYGAGFPNAFNPYGAGVAMPTPAVPAVPKQTQGPPGANLFIMQIPNDWRDESLRAAFAAFGNILSTRVFIDKMTGESKCFGFVSYDNAQSAAAAIATMNGFNVGGRVLQVSLKSGEVSAINSQIRSTPYQ